LCVFVIGSFCNFSEKQECDKIVAKAQVVDTSNGQSNGQVKIDVIKGDLKNVRYIFCVNTGKVLNETQFDKSSLSGLGVGEYFCIVSNSDCSIKISFTIK
jgi:hypothetical protein